MRTLHIEPLAGWIRALFEKTAGESDVEIEWGGELDGRELAQAAARADALVTVTRRVDADLIAAAPRLRLVQVQGRAPWAVDLDAAAAAGVPVSMLPHRGAIAVAEQTIALMLGLCRKVVPGHLGTRDADYRSLGTEPVRTTERIIAFNWLRYPDVHQLYGRVLGLVGLGGIGLEVARRARAFDMDVVYCKRSPLPPAHEAMAGVRHLPLTELLAASDMVSLHAPHTHETEGLIDAAALRRMKPTAILINTARGGLVDEDALLAALGEGRIAGAALDCFTDEPHTDPQRWQGLDNVILAPRCIGWTDELFRDMGRAACRGIVDLAQGRRPHGMVNPEVLAKPSFQEKWRRLRIAAG